MERVWDSLVAHRMKTCEQDVSRGAGDDGCHCNLNSYPDIFNLLYNMPGYEADLMGKKITNHAYYNRNLVLISLFYT